MNFKKVLALLLAAQMLLVSTVSCSETTTDAGTSADNAENAAAPGAEDNAETSANERTAIPDNLPDVTFNDQSFRVLTSESKEYQFFVEEAMGEGTNDAIFDRNLRIEDRFDVKIETIIEASPYAAIDQYVTSGDNVAEIVDHYQYKAHVPISKGNYLDWNTIPHIDQTQPWWNKASNDGATINGKLFCITGDLSVTAMRFTYAMFFNMDLMENYGYPSATLYNTVLEGNWTLDKLIETASTIYEDKNGDGIENDSDVFGYAYWNYHGTDVWVTAMGEKITSKEEDGTLTVTLGTEKVFSALEKLTTFVHSTTGAHLYKDEALGRTEFISGSIGIQPLMFDDCYTHLRDMEFAYGVLPFPKYDAEQENYYTNSMDQHSVFGTPKTLPKENYEFTGIIMEVLNAETYKTVYPAFYDTALKGKYSEDATTAEMIDLIMEGRVFEFSFQFGEYLASLPYMFRNCLFSNSTDLASTLQKNKKALNKKLKEMYEFYTTEEAAQ